MNDDLDPGSLALSVAAPDMLVALRHVRDGLVDMDEVEAAIAKAEKRGGMKATTANTSSFYATTEIREIDSKSSKRKIVIDSESSIVRIELRWGGDPA